MARAGRACADASRDAIFLWDVLVIDTIDAQRAFFHYAISIVVFAGAIGAGP